MLFGNYDHKSNVGRRGAVKRMICASSGALLACARGLRSLIQISSAQAATAAQVKKEIPIAVKDGASFFWRTVLARAQSRHSPLHVQSARIGRAPIVTAGIGCCRPIDHFDFRFLLSAGAAP
jgi:hypothetical protein